MIILSTTNVTGNPYNITLTGDTIITPIYEPIIATGSVTWKRTWSSTWTETLTIPPRITRIVCNFTWHYGSDERIRLGLGLLSGGGRGCGIRNASSNKSWIYYTSNKTMGVTPGKTYTFTIWVDGYKERDYGFTLSWSPTINTYEISENDL